MENLSETTVGLLLPTRGRYEALQRTLESLSRTINASRLEVIIVADQDEKSYRVAADFDKSHRFGFYLVYIAKDRLFPVKAFIEAFNLCRSETFCWMNDENIYEDTWLINAYAAFKGIFPDNIGVLSLYKMKKAGLGMTSKDFVRYNGSWFFPGYTLYYPDDELTCRAVLLGRYAFIKDNGIFHDSEITEGIPIIPAEEKLRMKKVDRGVFYRRTETNFDLDPGIIHSWKGFRNINEPLKK